jgi:hypothetical protein
VEGDNDKWEPCREIRGYFGIIKTTKCVLALQMNDLLAKYGSNVRVFTCVKDERNHLSTMTSTSTSILFYQILRMYVPFISACWGHAMSKCY